MIDFQFVLDLLQANVSGIPLIVPIVLLTEVIKQLGVSGNKLRMVALGLGAVFGLSYQFAVLGQPVDFAAGFSYFIISLTYGAFSFLSHDYLSALITKSIQRVAVGEE